MALSTANVNTVTDSFQNWIDRTNILLDAYSTTIVTVAANTKGGTTTGNATVNGIFTANSLTVEGNSSFGLRGGNSSVSNTLYITSNVSIGNSTVNTTITTTSIDTDLDLSVQGATTIANNLSVSGILNVDSGVLYVDVVNNRVGINKTNPTVALDLVGSANISTGVNSSNFSIGTTFVANTTGVYHTGAVNAASFTTTGISANATGIFPTSNSSGQILGTTTQRWSLYGNTGSFSGNVSIGSDASVNGGLVVAGTVSINTFANFITLANTNLGSNTTTNLVVGSFPKSSFSGGELTIYVNRGSEYQITKVLLAHNGTDVNQTVYGTVVAPSSSTELANNIVATINSSNVEISMRQRAQNSSVKILASLFS